MRLNYKTIRRSSTSELVIKEILDSIKADRLKPGDKLPPERELTQMFGVGRSTLREAISALVLVGYLKVVQGRGTFLKNDFQPLSLSALELSDVHAATSIIDLLEVREILECNAVKLAARRAGPQDIRLFQKTLAKMKASVDDVKRFSEHDFDLHMAIAQATGNVMIFEMMKFILKRVYKQYGRFKHKTLFQTDKAIVTAEQILFSVINGEEESASKHMQAHLNLVAVELKRLVPDVKRIHDDKI
jgi:GntR family transcriptional repressor for pyruvate dehydrogenase complex